MHACRLLHVHRNSCITSIENIRAFHTCRHVSLGFGYSNSYGRPRAAARRKCGGATAETTAGLRGPSIGAFGLPFGANLFLF